MKRPHPTLLILTSLLVLASDSLSAQSTDEETCIFAVEGQNRNRTVAGTINTECGWVTPPPFEHDPPFGNWGVDSNYGTRSDTDQFRGWKHLDGPFGKLQWNSCTTDKPEYWPPNCDYYNANNCTTQQTVPLSAVVTHGVMTYRTSSTPCPVPGTVGNEQGSGCRVYEGASVSQTSNYMTLYELDAGEDDWIDKLYFPGTSATLSGCTHDECPGQITSWVDMTDSDSVAAEVEAQLRMKAKATLHGLCDWDSGE